MSRPDADAIRKATTLILPGVGAFGEAVTRIDALGLRAPIMDHARSGRPMLGICLGMQLLFQESEESPGAAGLGLIPGSILKFREGELVVPHIGWNDVVPGRSVGTPLPRRADASTLCIRTMPVPRQQRWGRRRTG